MKPVNEEVLQIIKRRSSVRKFKGTPLVPLLINRLVEAACRAPSAGNLQPWYFYAVTGEQQKRALAAAAFGQGFIAEAPVCIVVCIEPERSARIYGRRGRSLYCIQDTAAATQNLLLAAEAYGLGACWVGAFDEERVAVLLRIPADKKPVALVPVGYPARETKTFSPRRELREVFEHLPEK